MSKSTAHTKIDSTWFPVHAGYMADNILSRGIRMAVKNGYKKTEVGVIPEGWGLTSLRSVLDSSRHIRYGVVQPGEFVLQGQLMLRSQDYSKGWMGPDEMHRISSALERQYRNARINSGDLIMTIVGAGIGQVVSAPDWLDGAILSRSTCRIAVDPRKAAKGYIAAFLESPFGRRQILDCQKEGAQPVVSCPDLARFLIPLPTLAEQEAIADALSDADAWIESLEQLIAKKRQIKQGAMQELLTGKRRLPGFSGKWETKRLGEIASLRNERVNPRRCGPFDFCIELEHIEQATGRLIGNASTTSTSSLKSHFKARDVLFGKLRAYLRKYWIARSDGVCSTEIWVFTPRTEQLTPEYLFQIITVDSFIDAASTAYGTHMPRSDWNVVKNYEMKLPSPVEQTAIATVLSDMDTEIESLESKLAKAREVKQGMMQELLTGRIRLV